jgi:hypothetical protein
VKGALIVFGSLAAIAALILVARLIDRMRGLDPSDRWSGWPRGKSSSAGTPRLYNGPEYSSMDDHGSHDADGGL